MRQTKMTDRAVAGRRSGERTAVGRAAAGINARGRIALLVLALAAAGGAGGCGDGSQGGGATAASRLSADELAAVTLAIEGGTVIDVLHGEHLEDALVLIAGDRIVHLAAGAAGSEPPLPAGAVTIDASGRFLVPGLADLHNHLGFGTIGLPPDRPPGGRDQAALLAELLDWGVTMVLNPNMELDSMERVRAAIAADPAAYPHFRATGPNLGAPGGWGVVRVRGEEQMRQEVRRLTAAGVDAIKVVYDDMTWLGSEPMPRLRRGQLAAAVDEAHRAGLTVYTHAPLLELAKEALEIGVDGLIHGVIDAPADEELIALLKRRDAVYISTSVMYQACADVDAELARQVEIAPPAARRWAPLIEEMLAGGAGEIFRGWWDRTDFVAQRLPVLAETLRRLDAAGVRIVTGSDSPVPGVLLGPSSLREIELHGEAGLSPLAVLRAATINAAAELSLDGETGSIEEGKLADLVILDADPLQDLSNLARIDRVIRAGRVVSGGERR